MFQATLLLVGLLGFLVGQEQSLAGATVKERRFLLLSECLERLGGPSEGIEHQIKSTIKSQAREVTQDRWSTTRLTDLHIFSDL